MYEDIACAMTPLDPPSLQEEKKKLIKTRAKDVDEVPRQACQTNIDVDNIDMESIQSGGSTEYLHNHPLFTLLAFHAYTFALVLSAGERNGRKHPPEYVHHIWHKIAKITYRFPSNMANYGMLSF